ncbi:inorganic phosphate transporter, partial [Rhizobium ruizarguesonis]
NGGEKIGKTHRTYGQGAAAEVVAMVTIASADHLGLPVSTTHVLSSGVAGNVSTQAISILRTVDHCRPDPFAAMVPAT